MYVYIKRKNEEIERARRSGKKDRFSNIYNSIEVERARQRNGNAFEISTPFPASPHRFPRRRNPAFIPPPVHLLALPLPPSRRRQAENKRRPFISGAYIIRFFTRPASPRMTNWNNNNGYILHGGPRHRGPRLKYIYCRCPRHNRILSDKKRTDPTALPYLSS